MPSSTSPSPTIGSRGLRICSTPSSYNSAGKSRLYRCCSKRTTYDKPNRSAPGVHELENILLACFEAYHKVFLVVDALDECPEDHDFRYSVLECLIRLSHKAQQVKVFVTSRELPDIMESQRRVEALRVAWYPHTSVTRSARTAPRVRTLLLSESSSGPPCSQEGVDSPV